MSYDVSEVTIPSAHPFLRPESQEDSKKTGVNQSIPQGAQSDEVDVISPNDSANTNSARTENITQSDFKLSTVSIDEGRPFKVVVNGAGCSGTLAGTRFLQQVKNIDLAIYEKNSRVGGTRFSNKYIL